MASKFGGVPVLESKSKFGGVSVEEEPPKRTGASDNWDTSFGRFTKALNESTPMSMEHGTPEQMAARVGRPFTEQLQDLNPLNMIRALIQPFSEYQSGQIPEAIGHTLGMTAQGMPAAPLAPVGRGVLRAAASEPVSTAIGTGVGAAFGHSAPAALVGAAAGRGVAALAQRGLSALEEPSGRSVYVPKTLPGPAPEIPPVDLSRSVYAPTSLPKPGPEAASVDLSRSIYTPKTLPGPAPEPVPPVEPDLTRSVYKPKTLPKPRAEAAEPDLTRSVFKPANLPGPKPDVISPVEDTGRSVYKPTTLPKPTGAPTEIKPVEAPTPVSEGSKPTVESVKHPPSHTDVNRQLHANAQDLELPGSPAGKNGHAEIAKAAKKVFGVDSTADLTYEQSFILNEFLLQNKRLPTSVSDLKSGIK